MKDGGAMDLESARALVANQALWPRVRDFLWDFAPQVHASWVESLARSRGEPEDAAASDASALSGALRGTGAHPRVKAWILKELGVSPCFHPFPKEDGSRLTLLDGATLESIAKWLGALACAEALRKVTNGATVRALKAAFPGVYPEVFGYTMYFSELVSGGAAEVLGEDVAGEVAGMGRSLLFSVLSGLPEPLVSRTAFKFPKGLRLSAQPRETRLPVVLKLLKLKFPEAHSLCCS